MDERKNIYISYPFNIYKGDIDWEVIMEVSLFYQEGVVPLPNFTTEND